MNRTNNRRQSLWASSILGLAVCGYLVTVQYASIGRPLTWDEVDYVQAAREGLAANYLERGTLSLLQFIDLARAKTGNEPGAVAAIAKTLPPEADSVAILRHNHPPLLTYLLAPWVSESLGDDQRSRWAYGGVAILLVGATWFRWGLGAGTLGFVALFTSVVASRTFGVINFHLALALAVAVLLIALAGILEDSRNERRRQVVVAATAAGVLLALETGILVLGLVALSLIVLHAPWRSLAATRTFALAGVRYAVWTVGLFWLFWLGSITTGAPATTHLRLVYQVFFIANDDFSRVQPMAAWLRLASENTWLVLFLACGLATFLVRFKQSTPFTRCAFVTGLGYCLIVTPFLAEVRYAFPGLVILTIASVEALNQLAPSNPRTLLYASIAALLLAATAFQLEPQQLRRQARSEREELERILATLRAIDTRTGPLLIDGAHIFRFYEPSLSIEALTIVPSFRGGGLFTRRDYEYVNVDEEASRHAFSAIVRQQGVVEGFGTRAPLAAATKAIIDREYPRQEVVGRYWIAQ